MKLTDGEIKYLQEDYIRQAEGIEKDSTGSWRRVARQETINLIMNLNGFNRDLGTNRFYKVTTKEQREYVS